MVGSPFFRVTRRLNQVMIALKDWHRKFYNFFEELKKINDKMMDEWTGNPKSCLAGDFGTLVKILTLSYICKRLFKNRKLVMMSLI